MNKRYLLYAAMLILACACSKPGPSMKVVVGGDELLGRYVNETADKYIFEVQDTCSIEKKAARVELWSASNGKGIVYLKDFGSAKVYSEPNGASNTISDITYEEGYVPETYRCLGYKDGWFFIELSGEKGYIQEELVSWDAIDTF